MPHIRILGVILLLFTLPSVAVARGVFIGEECQFRLAAPVVNLSQMQAENFPPRLTEEQARLQGGAAAAISGLLALTLLLRKRLSLQQRFDYAAQALKVYTLPPQTLMPGLVAHLCGSSSAALATLLDLAQRGLLRVEEKEPKWGQRVFEIVRLPVQESLQPHEEAFLEVLFRYPGRERVSLAQIAKVANSKSYLGALEDELVQRAWHSVERIDQRRRFAIFAGEMMALGLLFFAVGVGVGWSYPFGAILLGSGSGLVLAGFVGIVLTLSLSTLTDQGAQQAAQWKAFADYLKEITQGQHQPLSPETFERYLPYAAGFGFLSEWASYFFSQSKVNIPDWFCSNVAGDPSRAQDAFVAMILVLFAVEVSYAPASSETGGSSETVLSSVR
ncbi:MAG: DUF2207 domain-containing protein [Anaerolineales bacterium]|nr:DUF2207 domain-containing protein [Anaerolineales bacterium]MDW8446597.1 DUF2207 domain-containing protein [Anaerolineales bacterium]